MRKKLLVGVLLLSLGTLTGCSKVKQEVITDESKVSIMKEEAQNAISTYFDLQVNDELVMTESLIKNVPKEVYEDRMNPTYVFTAQAEGDPIEGQLYSYGLLVNEDQSKLLGVYSSVYSTEVGAEYTDEQIDSIAQAFLYEHHLVDESASLELLRVTDYKRESYVKMVTYQYGEVYILVNVSTQTGKVICFEFSS